MEKITVINEIKENESKKARKKILFVEQTYDGTIGGSHYCLLYIAQLLNRNIFDPIFMFYQKDALLDEFIKTGAKIYIYPKPKGRAFQFEKINKIVLGPCQKMVQKAYNFVRVTLIPTIRFMNILRKEKIDIVHLNNAIVVGVEWVIASKIMGKKCFTFQRGHHASLNLSRKIIGNLFNGIYCVSDVIRKNMLENGISSKICFTLYDGIDREKLSKRLRRNASEVRAEFKIGKDDPLIGMVANFMDWKGQDVLVPAVKLLTKKYPSIRCLIIGAVGTDEATKMYYGKIKAIVKAEKLDENVIITGYRTDIADLINALDIQVHPPTGPDPFPHVILEGMTLGKAIIASNIGGAIESLENEISGILIPPNDPQKIADKIALLLENKGIRDKIGENARKRVIEKFSIKENILNVEKIYN